MPAASHVPARPGYLLAALVAMWLVGLNAAQEGFGSIQLMRDPLTGNFSGSEAARSALVRALGANAGTELPLAIAQLMLGALLVFVATHILLGGRPRIAFAIQVLAANVAVLILAYALREPTRTAYVRILSETTEESDRINEQFWWRSRFVFGFDLVALGLSAFAFTRKDVKAFLRFVPEADR